MHSTLSPSLDMTSYTPGASLPTHYNWLTDSEVEAFWRSVEKLPNGCWYYDRVSPSGGRSGTFTYRHGNLAAHRVAWRLITGEILGNNDFLKPQQCGDQRCINPEHQLKVPRHKLQAPKQQHTANAINAHPAMQGRMTLGEVIAFLSRPGAASWTPPLGGSCYVWWQNRQYEGATLEEACRAARDAA